MNKIVWIAIKGKWNGFYYFFYPDRIYKIIRMNFNLPHFPDERDET